MVATDDPVIDLLDLFRGKPGTDGFDDVLVVSLAVKTAVDGIVVNTRSESLIIVMNLCIMLGLIVLDDN